MASRTVIFITIALFVGIAALVLHLLALCSPHWKITKRDLPPKMTPVSYGLWERCEYTNVTVYKQGVTVGTLANYQYCYTNHYMRYPPDNFTLCYNIRRRCPVIDKSQLPKECSCHYLPSTKGLQWLTILAAVFLGLGLILLYIKIIATPQNDSALVLLSYGPFICFLLTLLLMVSGLVLLGAYFRRDTYEDFSFPLQTIPAINNTQQNFDLNSLNVYAKVHGETFTREHYLNASRELLDDAHTHYHTIIGRATIFEITATALILSNTILTFFIGTLAKSEDL